MSGLFRRLANKIGEASAVKDMERHIGFYRAAGGKEAATLRVGAAMAFVSMMNVAHKENLIFLEDILNTGRPLDPNETVQLTPFIMKMNKARGRLMQQDNPPSVLAGNGFITWILTLRSFIYPALLPSVREMWQHIERGQNYYEDALSELSYNGMRVSPLWDFEAPPAFLPR